MIFLKSHQFLLYCFLHSPYFRKIFVENPCKHPVLILKDICGWEIQCIVDFMYKGETSVPEAQLNGLMKASESLKIQGLTRSEQQLLHQNLRSESPESPTIPSPNDLDESNEYLMDYYGNKEQGRGTDEAFLLKDPFAKLVRMGVTSLSQMSFSRRQFSHRHFPKKGIGCDLT